ncbi:MAG: transketolase family protein [Bacillota bacterium]
MRKAMREAYGEALAELGREFPQVVVLDADLAKATRTVVFGKEFPDRFYNMGISEANMVGVAAGLSLEGYIPFVSSFAVFVPGRVFDQVRNTICYSNLSVKLVATHAGISTGEDGGSHQSVEDLALTRSLPNMRVYVPADAVQTKAIVRYLAESRGPAYVRLPRHETPIIYAEGRSAYSPLIDVLRAGDDVTLAATGIMVEAALRAAEELERERVSCRVLNVHCLKPLDTEAILAAARETRGIVTIEDHSVIGGLGSAVAEVLSENCPAPLVRIGIQDKFGQSGTTQQLLEQYGLTVENIKQAARKIGTTMNRG